MANIPSNPLTVNTPAVYLSMGDWPKALITTDASGSNAVFPNNGHSSGSDHLFHYKDGDFSTNMVHNVCTQGQHMFIKLTDSEGRILTDVPPTTVLLEIEFED